ncbi:MAG: hypothetical protein L0Y38_05310 [Methylococcaceae bacterium]|nr:hypothetical protein [Methylococcaceae bacterium]MCI0668246.1 hypothetical protein [Methylococcaceae bacterium]MCI0733224.1 hypothetical protein [Methylococcaceae bacterium]
MAGDQDPSSDNSVYYPSDMLDLYKNMKFAVGGELVSIAVNRYRNNDAGSHPSAAEGGTQDALSIKDALMSLDSANIRSRAGGTVSYVDVFTGKGSPEAIAAVMKCFYDYSDRFIKAFGKDKIGTPRRKCADWLADPNTSWQDALQAISNEFIGLDCNGFVGNWLKKIDHALLLGPQQSPRDVYNRRRVVRKSAIEVQYCDIVVWVDFSHIAAINMASAAGEPHFDICQSAGGGPRMNDYIIRAAPSGGTFTLSGGIPASDVAGPVYIISPWPD